MKTSSFVSTAVLGMARLAYLHRLEIANALMIGAFFLRNWPELKPHQLTNKSK